MIYGLSLALKQPRSLDAFTLDDPWTQATRVEISGACFIGDTIAASRTQCDGEVRHSATASMAKLELPC